MTNNPRQQQYRFAYTSSLNGYLTSNTGGKSSYADLTTVTQKNGTTLFMINDEKNTRLQFNNMTIPLKIAIDGALSCLNNVFCRAWRLEQVNTTYPLLSNVDLAEGDIPAWGKLNAGIPQVVKGIQSQTGYTTNYGANYNNTTYVVFMHSSEFTTDFPIYLSVYNNPGVIGFHTPDGATGTKRYIVIFYNRVTNLIAPTGWSLSKVLTHELYEDIMDNNLMSFFSTPEKQGNLQTAYVNGTYVDQTYIQRIIEVCDACQDNIVKYRFRFSTGKAFYTFLISVSDFLYRQFFNYYAGTLIQPNGAGGYFYGPCSLVDDIIYFGNTNFPVSGFPRTIFTDAVLPPPPANPPATIPLNIICRTYLGEHNRNSDFPRIYNG